MELKKEAKRDSLHVRPDSKVYYDHEYHKLVHKKYYASDDYYWARAEAAIELNFKDLDTEQSKILEFGCGYGQNIACLPNAWGYDSSELARAESREHGVKVYDNLQNVPYRYFDIVLSRHCLEHVRNPLANLILLGKYLKPGGILILILPKERQGKVSLMPDVHQHLFCWNFRSINNLLTIAGFEVVLNKYQSVVGYKVLLPIRRILGKRAYYRATLMAGRFFRVTELVIHAKKP